MAFFFAGLAVSSAVAVLDLAVGKGTSLTGLLLAGSLIAAVAAGRRRTALVALYALALGFAIGVEDGLLGTRDHLTRLLSVAVGGGIAIWIAALRMQRERDSIRLGVQYSVARVLTEAQTLEDAAPKLLEAIGEPLRWEMGGLWEVRGPEALRYVESWCAPDIEADELVAVSRETVMRPGLDLPGSTWERGQPVWWPDVLAVPSFPRASLARKAKLRTGAGFPIRTSGGVVGVFELFSRRTREIDEDMTDLMAALGVQIGEFIDSQRAARELRESEARKAAMLASALDGIVTIDSNGLVVEFNPAAERIFGYAAEETIGREMAELIIPPSLRDMHRTALARIVETGEARILEQRLELTGMRSNGSELPVELTLTRISGGSHPTFTGFLRDITERKQAESEREELLRLEQLARVDAGQARDQLDAILHGVADGVTALAPDGSLIFANDAAVSRFGYDPEEHVPGGSTADVLSRFEILDESGGPFPVERLPGRLARVEGQKAEAIVRFRARDTGEESWSMIKSTPLFDADGQVAMAINVFEDISGHKRAEREQTFLADSSRILSSSLDPDELFPRVARLAVPDIADWCIVDVCGAAGGIERAALAHHDPSQVERAQRFQQRYPSDPGSATGVPNVLRTGQSELYEEIPEEMLAASAVDDEHLELLRAFGLRSAMVVPMKGRSETVGAITFVSGPSGRRFDRRDLGLAEELARRCAMALENARLFSERAYVAKTLQESLLPLELPDIPGLEVAARFHAAGEGIEVGGDFYDLFDSGAGAWTVVVGDVCGKGPDAAAVTALARYTLRAAAMHERQPSDSLRLLNEALLRQDEARRYCTVAYAHVEAGDSGARLCFVSGGHPLPLVLRRGGGVEWLGAPGTLLGAVPDPDFEDRSADLGPGDAVVFYTDGVTEAGERQHMLGEDKLVSIVSGTAGLEADGIAGEVATAALQFQNGSPRDDIAVVVLRVPG